MKTRHYRINYGNGTVHYLGSLLEARQELRDMKARGDDYVAYARIETIDFETGDWFSVRAGRSEGRLPIRNVKIQVVPVGQAFAMRGVVRCAASGKVLGSTRVVPHGMAGAAYTLAEGLAASNGWTVTGEYR